MFSTPSPKTFLVVSLIALLVFVIPSPFIRASSSSSIAGHVVAQIKVGTDLNQIAYNPYNREVYVSYGGAYGEGLPNVSIISASTNKVVKVIPDFEVGNFAYDPFNHEMYASLSTSVAVISPSNSVVEVVNLPASYAGALVYDSINHNMYVSSFNYMYAISSSTNKIVTRVQVQFWPFDSMAFDPSTNSIYAAEPSTNGQTYVGSIQVINLATDRVLSIRCGFCVPGGIIYDATNHRVFFTETDYKALVVISDSANKVERVAHFSNGALGLAYDAQNGMLLLSGYNNISEVNPSNLVVAKSFSIAGAPKAFALDTTSGNLYVTNALTEYVTVVSS